MATLDDKILGEKLHYYCSSDDEEESDSDSGQTTDDKSSNVEPKFIPTAELGEWEGSSTNTGPKGVLKDWQRYKQLETEKREEQEKEKIALIKRLSLSCQSHKDEEKLRLQEEQIEQELQSLLDDKILEEFKQKRMKEMMAQSTKKPRFGSILNLGCGQDYLDALDNEDPATTVVIYIFREGDKDCATMYVCLNDVAKEYPQVKFCSMEASSAGMSKHFKKSGVPALLVYKNGSLIGNFVRLTDELSGDFVSSDVENYLLEHGMLPDNTFIRNIRGTTLDSQNSDTD